MLNSIIAQAESPIDGILAHALLFLVFGYGIFFAHLYIFRSIFNIPSFLRYQKAQVQLLEEMAKKQGVDNTKVANIITESFGWEGASKPTGVPQNKKTN
ncbi:hypothetical protein HDF24_07440 [Mucilaginibacter sp. X4EP1]|uniref:hypothetical protein n=1 Tax=Mucilaginibacter sp. X4EP1 TaxID=2723092 RepID=UPI00216A4E0E|nr:hypothetical protein [Mucilaginibacter sp. X4EP1]MCS3814146.1 uncharacterized protein YybS (DUF2232 family) [Mucilaginibacter sp. X4EP1]